jgi:hypothetical protein
MYILIIFAVFCIGEYIFYRMKLDDVNDYLEVGSAISGATGIDKHKVYKKSIMALGLVTTFLKSLPLYH